MASQTDADFSAKLSRFLAENTNPKDRLALSAFLDARPKHSNLSVKFSQFLTQETTNPEDLLALEAFFDAHPKYSKPTSYISDIEQRLELLRGIQRECEKGGFELNSTAALWSALMVAPLERLRYLRDSPFLRDSLFLPGVLQSVTNNIPLLLKVFLTKNPSQDELLLAHASRKRQRSSVRSQASSAPGELNLDMSGRNKNESNKCEERDRCCVVTGAANPDICYIFPFAATKNQDRTSSSLLALGLLWGTQVFQQLKGMLVGDGNIIDTAPNMVALGPLLHRWWGKAIIGFEPIEKIEKGIRLRVRWLPKTTLAMKDKVAFDLNPLDCLQPYSEQDGYVGISHSRTHRPIIDGTVIDITAQDKSAIPSWDMFSLQWDLIRIASLCGAAEASDDDDWESDDDDEAPQAKVARTGLDSPITALATPGFQPLQSLPPQSLPLQSVPVQSQAPSPTKALQSQESLPIESLQSRESSPAKSQARRVDENNPW